MFQGPFYNALSMIYHNIIYFLFCSTFFQTTFFQLHPFSVARKIWASALATANLVASFSQMIYVVCSEMGDRTFQFHYQQDGTFHLKTCTFCIKAWCNIVKGSMWSAAWEFQS